MNTHRCPVCTSRNTTLGIPEWSTNVVLHCNFCNFRDVFFYGDSRDEADKYLLAVSGPRHIRVRLRVDRLWPSVSRVQIVQHRRGEAPRRYRLAFLPLMRSRVVEEDDIPFGDVFIAGMRISEFL